MYKCDACDPSIPCYLLTIYSKTKRISFCPLHKLLEPNWQKVGIISYRRDGNAFTLFTDDALQAVEGEQVGTPSKKDRENELKPNTSGQLD